MAKNTHISNIENNPYIIGIGASAGGLEAINELFDNMPSDTGFSFVIVQHLSPDHRSLMPELLSKHTAMPVFEAQDGMIPQADSIYLLPSRKIITIKNGRLNLNEKLRDHQPNTVIDLFFDSLAKDKQERALAIILSGTGTDGTKGIQAIKNNGGTVVVQDPISAQFDGMPNSAVSSGYVDLILAPDMIPDELLEFVREAPFLRSFNALSNQEEAILVDILDLVYRSTGHDFSNYKRPTINRRLAKRMAEKNIKTLGDYYQYLSNHPEEVKNLCREFLLHVTQFFRDEEAFETLRRTVIPELVSKKSPGDALKIWTVACSTGEEAYSLAILFDEFMEAAGTVDVELKIFASDISQAVIEVASRGIYSEDQVKNVSPGRLKKYFTRETHGYKIEPNLRKMIVFAKHDIAKDPPFSKIDLLTCRNMLIYMNPLLQRSILQKFHFALNEEGFLFLGPSENVSLLKDVLQEIDKKWKIYKCISKVRVTELESFHNPAQRMNHPSELIGAKSKNALNHLNEIFKETLMEEHDYAGIFIDRDFEVKQAIGNFKKFLDFPEGNFNFNLLKLVPTELSVTLSTGIRKAMKDHERVVHRNVKVHAGNRERYVTIIIKPYLLQKNYLQPFLFIVLKEEEPSAKKHASSYVPGDAPPMDVIHELEEELRDTKENLQALLEEVESSNEELQSSNEEIVSSNEELQSTNEELQSLNEELHTVNAEHQQKIKELIELNDDFNNYFRNTDIGQVFIDQKMTIRKFTPAVTRQVNLIENDIGRSIIDISTNIKGLDFINDIKSVMQKHNALEREITMEDGKLYLMRIVPYLRQGKTMDGVVVNFIDVTEVKKLNSILEAVFNSSTSGILALKTIRNEQLAIVDFEFISANKAAAVLVSEETGFVGRRLFELFPDVDPGIFETYVQVVETGSNAVFEYYNPRFTRWLEVVVVKMMDGLVVTFSDISERKSATEKIEKGYEALKVTSQELEASNLKLQQSNMDLLQFASVASHDLKEPLRKIQAFGNLLKAKIERKLDDSETNYLDKVINSSHRMQVLIDDILTLSRLSKNDTPYEQVDLNNLINQISDDIEISIREKNAKLHVGHLPKVKANPGQLRQLYQNLLSNAIKFNDGAPVVNIKSVDISPELEREFGIKAEDYVATSVSDNGIGFDERFTEKIFGIFQRLDKTNYTGSGIGLAIVKKIVDNHGGFIKVKSEEGKGSEFVLLFPK